MQKTRQAPNASLPKHGYKRLKIAVTGATGFVGAALLDILLTEGCSVNALVRDVARLTPRAGLTIIPGDLENEDALHALATGTDAFIHLAGLTHARRDEDYARVNIDGARNAAHAAAANNTRFVHASSLSAREPDLSPYAHSKRMSETAIKDASGSNGWIALRLPAIYGPGDRATLPYFKLIKNGLALEPATTPQARASIIYVDDAARALYDAARAGVSKKVLEVGDEKRDGHSWQEIGMTLGNIMNKKVRRMVIPRPIIALTHGITRTVDNARGRISSVRSGQINEFFHADWSARDNLFSDETGWQPTTPLKEGFAKTVLWYQDNGLL